MIHSVQHDAEEDAMSIVQINPFTHIANEIALAAPRPAPLDGITWLDVNLPTEDDLAWLQRTFNFHPLAIEDCRTFNQRAKVEMYDGHMFFSFTTCARDGDVHPHEMEAFLGPDYLVTVHREPLSQIETVRAHTGANIVVKSHDFLMYLIIDGLVDAYFPLIDELEDEIDELEDEILENATQSTLQRIYNLKRQLVALRKLAAPMRDVMNALASTRYALIDNTTALYFRDAFDHLARIYDLIETSRDLLGNALDAYLSSVSNKLNEVMKRLTLLTTIFMPISFLVGFGGMNFKYLPFDEAISLWIMMALLIIVPGSMWIWFKKSKWV